MSSFTGRHLILTMGDDVDVEKSLNSQGSRYPI